MERYQPFNLVSTDIDDRADIDCGLVPTNLGDVYPAQLGVTFSNLFSDADAIQAVRWVIRRPVLCLTPLVAQ
jgi:hypothetical protein